MFYRARTGMMFVLMTLMLTGLGSLVGYIFGRFDIGLIIMLAISVVICIYSYYGSKAAAFRAHDVHLVTEAEEPRLYGIVRKLSEQSGLPMPEVGVSETMMPNAFATGRNPENAAVVATRGLLHMLPDDELEGVFAHEMSHVKNRDILVMSTVSTMAAVLNYGSQYLSYAILAATAVGSREDNSVRGLGYIMAILLSVFVPIASALIQMGVSRSREYLADETGGRMTGEPRALARALRHIEEGCAKTEADYVEKAYADMWISNPLTGKNRTLTSRLFSTHPPTEERIKKLNDLADKLDAEKKKIFDKKDLAIDPDYKSHLY